MSSLAAAREDAFMFGCGGDTLVGILHTPEVAAGEPSVATAVPAAAPPAHDLAVLVVVGGPQYRAGSHRQFVQVARAVCAAGYPVLRFDYRGMGDSGGAARNFEHVSDDIGAAIDALQQRLPGVRRVVLWGLCDGASAALLYCERSADARVLGVCALNPWVRSEASLARTQVRHYYLQRLLQRDFWAKLLSGRVARGALAELLRKLGTARRAERSPAAATATAASYQARMARGWQRLQGRLLLVLSGNDYTAKEFIDHSGTDAAWRAGLAHPGVARHDIAGADHTFSDARSRAEVERLTLAWLARLAGAGPVAA